MDLMEYMKNAADRMRWGIQKYWVDVVFIGTMVMLVVAMTGAIVWVVKREEDNDTRCSKQTACQNGVPIHIKSRVCVCVPAVLYVDN